MKRNLMIAAGTLCVGLGIVGIFIPILPTTPFLLLAAALYAKSSRRFYHWLINAPHLGVYIRNYREGRGMTALHKGIVLLLLWGVISYSALVAIGILWVKILLYLIAAGVSFHILTIPTARKG